MRKSIGRVALILTVAVLAPACNDGPKTAPTSTVMKPSDPDIETFATEGSEHVPTGTQIAYLTDPPTSGSHYADFLVEGGFYTGAINPSWLVHSMEHGAVIIYFNSTLTAEQRDRLMAFAAQHPGRYSQVVALPRNDPTYPIILTAWTHRLRLTEFDAARIEGFMTLYLGQGPEREPM